MIAERSVLTKVAGDIPKLLGDVLPEIGSLLGGGDSSDSSDSTSTTSTASKRDAMDVFSNLA